MKVAFRSPEERAAFKASGKSPFGQAPTLEVNDVQGVVLLACDWSVVTNPLLGLVEMN